MIHSPLNIGRRGALHSLAGAVVSPPPVALFTWEFDYLWQVAGLEPWQLACGDHETWHRAHMALLERHQPDLLWSSGAGRSSNPPRVVEEGMSVYESCNRSRGRTGKRRMLTLETHAQRPGA